MTGQPSIDRRRAFSIAEVAATVGLSRASIYREIAAGNLRARKLGCRTIILDDELDQWLHASKGV